MTLRQILNVIQRRRLLVLIAVIVTIGAGAAYVSLRADTYQSQAIVQLPASSATTPTIPPSVSSPASIQAAATALHISDGAASVIAGRINATFDGTSNQMTISIIASTPQAAESQTNAFAQGYVSAVVAQAQTSLSNLKNGARVIENKIQTLNTDQAKQSNPVTTADLEAATASYEALQSQIDAAEIAPPPATIDALANFGSPTGESKKKVLLIAALLGLVAGCGLALVRDQFDTRVREGAGGDAELGYRVLGRLPMEPSNDPRRSVLPVIDNPSSLFAERIRDLRTTLQATLSEHPRESSVLLLTSPAPGDGKSFIAANLAAVWALAGRHTVVVSTDLRRPRLDALFGVTDAKKGLSTLMRLHEDARRDFGDEQRRTGRRDQGEPGWTPSVIRRQRSQLTDISLAEVVDALMKTRVEFLSLLPSGPRVDIDPADLLASNSMRLVIDRLRDVFDYVIIDTPAASVVPDAGTLASLADGVLLIVRTKRTDTSQLRETASRLEAGGAKILGVVVNLTDEGTGEHHAYYHADHFSAGKTADEVQS